VGISLFGKETFRHDFGVHVISQNGLLPWTLVPLPQLNLAAKQTKQQCHLQMYDVLCSFYLQRK
jgi:hypothetical protein